MFSLRNIKREKELIDLEIELYRKEKKVAHDMEFTNLVLDYHKKREEYRTEIQVQSERIAFLKNQFEDKKKDYNEKLDLEEKLVKKELVVIKDSFNTFLLSKDKEIEMLKSIITAFTAKLPDIKLESLGQTVNIKD